MALGAQLEAAYASLGLLNLHDEALFKLYAHLPSSGPFTHADALAQLRIDAERIATGPSETAPTPGRSRCSGVRQPVCPATPWPPCSTAP